jgi:hypothetical protein
VPCKSTRFRPTSNGGTPVRLGYDDNYSPIPAALSGLTLLITTALIYWDFSDRTVFRSFAKSRECRLPSGRSIQRSDILRMVKHFRNLLLVLIA